MLVDRLGYLGVGLIGFNPLSNIGAYISCDLSMAYHAGSIFEPSHTNSGFQSILTLSNSGNAIRVPTPNVSMAIMNLNLKCSTDKEELNDYMRQISLNSKLQNQIDYTASNEIVSSDLVGSRHAGVLDSQATIVNDDRAVLYVWYDNEFGYSCQVVRVMHEMSDIHVPALPAT